MTNPRRTLESRGRSTSYVTTGGAGYVPPTISNTEKVLIDGSKKIMSIIQNANMDSDGVPQDTYLLPRNIQRKQFLKKGYIEGNKGDYGLVRKAVGNRSIPIYQKNPDAISRDKLIVLGNTYSPMFDTKHRLEHPGNAPTAVYTDGHGKYYQKQWDLNDYGGDGGSTAGIAGKLLDFVGSPTVVTTGFQEINDKTHPWFGYIMKDIMKNKGLVPTEIDGETKFTLPEVVVIGRKKERDGGSIHIKPSKVGTFRAAASRHGMGVQEFASRVLANKDNYSSAMVKKANFARNASKWH